MEVPYTKSLIYYSKKTLKCQIIVLYWHYPTTPVRNDERNLMDKMKTVGIVAIAATLTATTSAAVVAHVAAGKRMARARRPRPSVRERLRDTRQRVQSHASDTLRDMVPTFLLGGATTYSAVDAYENHRSSDSGGHGHYYGSDTGSSHSSGSSYDSGSSYGSGGGSSYDSGSSSGSSGD
jgi:uncharacterized membrane protein YgcG